MTVQAHTAWRYRNPADQGIGLHIIDCDLRHHTNKPADGIRTVIITESKP